jgi:hypothetical protein
VTRRQPEPAFRFSRRYVAQRRLTASMMARRSSRDKPDFIDAFFLVVVVFAAFGAVRFVPAVA